MKIGKTMLLVGMALALAAFAVPPVAQGTVRLTDPDGTALKAGDQFIATTTNLKMTTESGVVSCAHVQLHLEVVTNGPNHVVIKQLGEGVTSDCHLLTPGTLPVTITDWTFGVGAGNEFTINTWNTGETNAKFISKVYGGIRHGIGTLLATCEFHGKVHLEATHPSPNNGLLITGSKMTGTGAGCPKEATMHSEFTMETAIGNSIALDFAATT